MAGREVARVVNRCREAMENNKLGSRKCLAKRRDCGCYKISDFKLHQKSIKSHNIVDIDLSSCHLTHVPDAIFLLLSNIELKFCSLSHNLLRRLPSKFATKFNLLMELDLSNNHLSSLPEELKHMELLSVLNISHNDFSSLPSIVYKLESLKIFSAEKNAIKEVDVFKLKQLKNISEINMQDNPLTQDAYYNLLLLKDSITLLLTPQDSQIDSLD